IEGLTEPLEKIVEEERLGEIKGIGKALQEKVTALVTTGELEYYDTLKASVPEGLVQMTEIPGLGPKKVVAIHKNLGIESLEALEAACKAGEIAPLAGFGKKSETKIIDGIEHMRKYASRHYLNVGLQLAEPILDDLRAHPDAIRCSTAGSLHRS
ncbi:MAG: helix-hairpin-helix domain-containing protein, partial [Verrucomicrobiia bacterium]